MNTEEFYDEVNDQIRDMREKGIKEGYLLLNRSLYEDVRSTEKLRHVFINKYEQRIMFEKGDTFMGLEVCVSSRERRLCKVMPAD